MTSTNNFTYLAVNVQLINGPSERIWNRYFIVELIFLLLCCRSYINKWILSMSIHYEIQYIYMHMKSSIRTINMEYLEFMNGVHSLVLNTMYIFFQ